MIDREKFVEALTKEPVLDEELFTELTDLYDAWKAGKTVEDISPKLEVIASITALHDKTLDEFITKLIDEATKIIKKKKGYKKVGGKWKKMSSSELRTRKLVAKKAAKSSGAKAARKKAAKTRKIRKTPKTRIKFV